MSQTLPKFKSDGVQALHKEYHTWDLDGPMIIKNITKKCRLTLSVEDLLRSGRSTKGKSANVAVNDVEGEESTCLLRSP